MRVNVFIVENKIFPFNISFWSEFEIIPSLGDLIDDYFEIEYNDLEDYEKKRISQLEFDKYDTFLSNTQVCSNHSWTKDIDGQYCKMYLECI